MNNKPWEIWAWKAEVEGTLVERARGKLPEMESTKQLVTLVREVYQPGMSVLDVGCNTGHYLVGLRRMDPNIRYVGVDAYDSYIRKAKEVFADYLNARFEVKSLMQPLFPEEPFDIVFSCNVLLHLPEFKNPTKNLLESTKKVCFIRTLLGDKTTIVRRAAEPGMDFDEAGNPRLYIHQNTYEKTVFADYINKLGWQVQFIEDQFDPTLLDAEYKTLKRGEGTRVIDGKQADGNIIFNWLWAKITR